MPNTDPITDNIASVEYMQLRAKEHGHAKVYVIGALTKQSKGEEISGDGNDEVRWNSRRERRRRGACRMPA